MKRVLATVSAVCALGAAACLTAPTAGGQSADPAVRPDPSRTTRGTVAESATPGVSIVVLRGRPLATYDGGLEGLSPTAPRDGHRFDAGRPSVQAYGARLARQHERVLSAIGHPRVLYSYMTAVNGFAADLDRAQTAQLRSTPAVLMVEPSRLAKVDAIRARRATGSAPVGEGQPVAAVAAATESRAVGGDRPTGRGLAVGGGQPSGRRVAGDQPSGRGVVVGVIDSGIWPENPSFAGLPVDPGSLHRDYPGFTGTCEDGESWTSADCNAKVIAAQSFVAGFGATDIAASEYLSPRDGTGHGSHTAGIAVGNSGVHAMIDGQDFGHLSGVAPDAALSVYKACWAAPNPAGDGCTTADRVAAIDRAVSDGVDVINYSVAGAATGTIDAVGLAFHNAASAGVVVATSAGDNGPGRGSVHYPEPWVTTVAATNHNPFRGRIVLGDGRSYVGSMVADDDVGPLPLVSARTVPATGFTASHAALCEPGSLDAAAVEGKIVVCDRGVIPRVDKGFAVDRAGGAAMVLLNVRRGPTEADVHAVPTVQLRRRDGAAVRAYLAATPRAVASLEPASRPETPVRDVADFSARGPAAGSAGGEFLKPDLAAPGVGVLAAVSPPANFGRLWDLSSGTSVAAPQAAGLAARIVGRHPTWSPAAVKSAMMTSASRLDGRVRPFGVGAGEADVRAAVDPGLVFDTKPGGVNQPSIFVRSLVGARTVRRTVTNVSGRAETYTAGVSGLRGLSVSVTPPTLVLRRGETGSLRVSLSARRSARYGRFSMGELALRGSRGHVVTSPVVVRPQLVHAPGEVTASAASRHTLLRPRAGVTGTLRASASGLIGARPVRLSVPPGALESRQPTRKSTGFAASYAVVRRTAMARFEVAGAAPDRDLDLYVYRDTRLVAAKTSKAAREQVTLERPAPGRYDVFVDSPSPAGERPAAATVTGWAVPESGGRRLIVGPRPVTVTGAQKFRLALRWNDLPDGKRWLGYVDYNDTDARTYLELN